MKKLQIVVIGGYREGFSEKTSQTAIEVGREIAARGHILVTGMSTGIGALAAKGAKEKGGLVVGVSPASSRGEEEKFLCDSSSTDVVITTGMGFKGRNVTLVRSADAVIAIEGKFGTLNEATIALSEKKPLVSIVDSGGTSDLLSGIIEKLEPGCKLFTTAQNAKEALEKAESMAKGML